MAFTSETEVLASLADLLKVNGQEEVPAHYAKTIIPRALQAAYQDILGTLLARGFSKAQVDSWDRGAELELSIALYWCLINGGAYGTFEPETVRALDRRKELQSVLVFTGGVWIQPPAGNPGLVTTSGPSATGSIFHHPGADEPGLGEDLHW